MRKSKTSIVNQKKQVLTDCIINEPVKWVTRSQIYKENSIKHGEAVRFTCRHQTDTYYDITCENGIFNTDDVICYPR